MADADGLEPTEPQGPTTEPQRLEPHRLLAASLASVVAAGVTSRFGVAGTLVGAAITPAIVMLTATTVESGIERGRTRDMEALEARRHPWRWALRHPRRLAQWAARLSRQRIVLALSAAVLAFGLALITITVLERAIGRPLSSIGQSGGSRGTTLAPQHRTGLPKPPANPTPEVKPIPTTGGKTVPETATQTETTPTTPAPTTPTPTQTQTQPGAGLGRNTGCGPVHQGAGISVLNAFLGDVQVAQIR